MKTDLQTPVLCTLLVLVLTLQTGCVKRQIRVTSEPSGALVYLNDVQVGRTPTEAEFKFYGTYDVRLELEGHETVAEGRAANPPIWEYPFVDIAAILAPVNLENTVHWHFDLVPTAESTSPEAAENERLASIDRALELRQQTLGEQVKLPLEDR